MTYNEIGKTYTDVDLTPSESKYIPPSLLAEMMWFLFNDDPIVLSAKEKGREHVWCAFNKLYITYIQSHQIYIQLGGNPMADELTERFYNENKQ